MFRKEQFPLFWLFVNDLGIVFDETKYFNFDLKFQSYEFYKIKLII